MFIRVAGLLLHSAGGTPGTTSPLLPWKSLVREGLLKHLATWCSLRAHSLPLLRFSNASGSTFSLQNLLSAQHRWEEGVREEGGGAFLLTEGKETPQNLTLCSQVPGVINPKTHSGQGVGGKCKSWWVTPRRFTWLQICWGFRFAKSMPLRAEFGSVSGWSWRVLPPHSRNDAGVASLLFIYKVPMSKFIAVYA